ncbi:MAG: hypothetical protein [Caudoviricetes sp.]|nr:MAG: hypothetical protein [Caudoviricetes sp.]
MATFFKVDDEFKRTLGFLPEDESLDEQSEVRMNSVLTAAELYVQNAIGESDSFYQSENVLPLYKLACYAVAVNLFNHPSSASSTPTASAIIAQMRGAYDLYKEGQDNGSASNI